jgi:hypothetical protein
MGVTRKKGSQTRAIYKNGVGATAYGTAVAGGTGDRIRAQITPNYQVQELVKNMIGSGKTMQDDIIAGRITPVVSLQMDAGYRNGADQLAAQFFSAATAPAEQTASQSDYMHRFTLNPVENAIFGTFAYELTTAAVAELPSCAVRTFETSFSATDELVQLSCELLGNDLILNSSTNTNATIASATEADGDCVVVKLADDFWINAESGGALSSGDQYTIMSYTRSLARPQEHMGNVKGSAGNSKPLAGEMATGTIAVTLEALDDITKFSSWKAGDFFKCLLQIEGSQIGTGDNKTWAEYTPRMKLVQAPVYNITSSGYNSVSMTFVIMEAAANPTGMASTLPYLEITNGRSAAYIA